MLYPAELRAQLSTSQNLNSRRLVRQTVFCDPQIHKVFCGSRKQFSCQPTEARGFERHSIYKDSGPDFQALLVILRLIIYGAVAMSFFTDSLLFQQSAPILLHALAALLAIVLGGCSALFGKGNGAP